MTISLTRYANGPPPHRKKNTRLTLHLSHRLATALSVSSQACSRNFSPPRLRGNGGSQAACLPSPTPTPQYCAACISSPLQKTVTSLTFLPPPPPSSYLSSYSLQRLFVPAILRVHTIRKYEANVAHLTSFPPFHTPRAQQSHPPSPFERPSKAQSSPALWPERWWCNDIAGITQASRGLLCRQRRHDGALSTQRERQGDGATAAACQLQPPSQGHRGHSQPG